MFATVAGKVRFEHATKDKKRIRVEAVETAPAASDRLDTEPQPATTGGAMALHGRRRRRTPVKPDIHPKYYQAKVHCGSCGTELGRRIHPQELRVDVCSNCHPFFTGKQTIIDTAGQVERFQKRLERQARS